MSKRSQSNFVKEEQKRSLLNESEFHMDEFPTLTNMSSAFMFDHLPIPRERKKPEFVFLNQYDTEKRVNSEIRLAVAEWNMVWEMGHLRNDFFARKLPQELKWLTNYENQNIYLVPDEKLWPYQTYAPIFHLLPYHIRKNFGLPLIKKGAWPFLTDIDSHIIGDLFKRNFLPQLSKAFAHHIWSLLDSQSNLLSYTKDEPLSLLAHNLKFWLPSMYCILEEAVADFGRIEPQSPEQVKKMAKLQKRYPELDIKLPLRGGNIWTGENEAWYFTEKLVEHADSEGHLRNIIDAIKSNRVRDDFSEKWSFAREDFERKLYSKRSKVKVSFVEINDAIPIHSRTTEFDDNYLWDDLLSILDRKEKRVVVLLRKGVTNHKEIGEILGYKNHSPVTKTFKRIRDQAARYLDIRPGKL